MTLAMQAPALLPTAGLKTRIPRHKDRVLLALDGGRLAPGVSTAALAACVRLADRLDILLVNPPKAATSLLCGLLLRLEHSGIDYRLASVEGELADEVLSYLNRYHGIATVLVDTLAPLERMPGAAMAQLRAKGIRFLPFC
jgi:hypothetical protein